MAKQNKRQKICHNCEADIDLDVIVCPFCAADLREERPMREISSPLKTILKEQVAPTESVADAPRASALPIALVSVGGYLLLLGVLTLMFSEGGQVTLQWDSRYWFLALIASIPLLVFGVKMLSKEG